MLLRSLLLAVLLGPSLAASPLVAASTAEDPGGRIVLRAFEPVALRGAAGRAPNEIDLTAFGRDFRLALRPNDALLAALPEDQRARLPDDDLFLAGTLTGVDGSWARLNRIDGQWFGGFFDGRELYLLDRAGAFASGRAAGLDPDQAILFRFADLDLGLPVDDGAVRPGPGSDEGLGTGDYLTFVGHLRALAAATGQAMFAVPLTVVSDTQFTADHSGNPAPVVVGRVNFVDGIYSSQLGTGILLLHHEILTDNGPLTPTDSADLLAAFRSYMASGDGSDLPFGGLAHLFTGRNLDGNIIGRAYLGVLCSSTFGYGIDQNVNSNTTSSLLIAHELGHNFNAPHDGQDACASEPFRGIMNPSINGSQQFSDCSLEQMSQEVAGASCLVDVSTVQIVFEDSFEID